MIAAVDLDQLAIALASEAWLVEASALPPRQPQTFFDHLRSVSRETFTPSFVSRTSAARLGPKLSKSYT
jgi:hypothetical protein